MELSAGTDARQAPPQPLSCRRVGLLAAAVASANCMLGRGSVLGLAQPLLAVLSAPGSCGPRQGRISATLAARPKSGVHSPPWDAGSSLPLTMRLLAGLVLCLAAVGASASLYTEGGDVVVIASSADLKATLKPGAGALVEFYAPWQVPGSGSPERRVLGACRCPHLIIYAAVCCWSCCDSSPCSRCVWRPCRRLPTPVLRRCRRCTAPPSPAATPDLPPCQRVSRLACLDTASMTAAAFAHGGCRRCLRLLGAAARSFLSIRPPHSSASLRSCRCGHCKNLKPEWTRAAQALKGILPVAAVDADAHRDLGQEVRGQGWSCNARLGGAAHVSKKHGWGPGGPPAHGPLAVD